ncbi:hypothetical protein CHLRE_12g542850v5 [Chlamydomonas reinhardtii]|uniref:Acireductone dioxygenase n=1 Tax=Chlamydomonas reinhardtii TaxID=3055 RepID=A8IY04_CHLRE|nr:uncharacterized protein CHLRE_12g542850v5 [Chlamydomonas reinhardtii]PNW76229.1 hypothetical protein CHLRE_12g542850v5 [Chlamydomonas reinhardtii]|eukprot:XP_001693929.1 aci-reductone dioxygenase [Chlamydomonas reinhardtii]
MATAEFTAEELALAQPEKPDDATIEAWYMDDSDEDQRLPHKLSPNQPCPLSALRDLGVLYWKLDADKHETDPRLAAIRKVYNYSYTEIVNISKDTLPDYEAKIKSFYLEHIHSDDEIRYILDGSGYFDVRDHSDRWIRIATRKGDLLVLPEGIYHRFTLDTDNYTKAMRLFVGAPVWTPHNRPQEEHPSRAKYLDKFPAPIKASA